ncbi:carbohydrate ABC transporter permease [Euzebya tangerina]|uniref:carbohydrate ABC transporter permease n=1 Tax=Euzebya tangerina TaxID=591198 RepID=UPI000E30C747|nr:sugar ABC transporter permease [Euzebya tangerina]
MTATPIQPGIAPAQPTPRRAGRRGRRSDGRAASGFLAPGGLLLGLFVVGPFIAAIVLSLTNWRLVSPLPTQWVGLENYRAIIADSQFWIAIRNNLTFAVLVVPLQTILALAMAVLVNRPVRGRVVIRTIYFLPVVTVMTAAAVIWRLLLTPDGAVNSVLGTITFGALEPNWLTSTTAAMPAVVLVSIWQGAGFQMVILLAALQGVPSDLYEAASIDGATRWQTFRHITVPGIRNALIFVVTVTTILAFRLYDQVVVLPTPAGGPRDATRTMMLEMVQTGFGRQLIGRASAIAVLFFVIVLALTALQRALFRESP